MSLAPGSFRVILADPPWAFSTRSHRGQGRGASQHYDTMPTADICALAPDGIPVAELAAKDAALFLWGTWPHLPDALQVIAAWGFEYRSCGFVWIKQNKSAATLWCDLDNLFLGLGYGTRGNSEFCLRAQRGQMGVAQDRGVAQLIVAPIREHNRKPDEQYQRIERLYAGPYLELFARARRPGWSAWGNQVGKFGGEVASPAPSREDPGPNPLPTGGERERGTAPGEGVSAPWDMATLRDIPDIPAFLNRANWTDGGPP